MANREHGEVSITIGGKVYTMKCGLKAMKALEAMFSTPQQYVTFQEVSELCDRGSMTHTEALLWAVLQKHHPEVQLKDIDGLIDAAGGLGVFTVKLMEMARAMQPDARDLAALGIPATANPQPAQATKANRGTGGRSSSAPDAKA